MKTIVSIGVLVPSSTNIKEVKFEMLGFSDFIINRLNRDLKDAGIQIEKEAKDNVSVDRGNLQVSIKSEFDRNKTTGASRVDIFPKEFYGVFLEFGTRPHFPPSAPLIDWAVRHGMPPSAGYAIQQKIGKEGTKPAPYLIPAYNKVAPKYKKNIDKTITRALQRANR